MENYLLPEDDGLPLGNTGKWAAIKLDYLSRYIDIFETAMRQKWRYRNYIDLFSGPGKNRERNSRQVSFGSPLLSLTRFWREVLKRDAHRQRRMF